MGRFSGDTYKILCGGRGIDNNLNINAIEPNALIWPSKNIDLSEGGWGRRKSTTKFNGTVITDAPRIMGLFDYLKIGGAQHILFSTDDGKIFKNATTTIKTGLGASKYGNFELFDNLMYFCNGYNIPCTWDGVAGSTTDFTTGVKAQGTITMAGIPLVGVKAQGTVTFSGVPTQWDTLVMGVKIYTWRTNRVNAREVTIGATAADCATNLVTAIGLDSTDITAEVGSSSTVIVTAAENKTNHYIVFVEASTNVTVDGSGYLGGTTTGRDDEKFSIGSQRFTWVALRPATGGEGQVTIGTTAATCVTQAVYAINTDSTVVTAIDGDGNTVLVTAVAEGVAGNELLFLENVTNMTMDGGACLGATTAGVDDQIPSDWTGGSYPSVFIRHGKGNSERMWAFGCTSNPYTLYVSLNGNAKAFGDTDVITLSLNTGDDTGLVGAAVFKDHLILFGKNQTFIVDDADTDTTNWGYTAFTRVGGVAHQRLVISTPNDIILMQENGEIYSLTAAEQYGDYKAASIVQAKHMNRWIKDNVRLSYIEHFHGIYDPVKRVVKIFVVRKEQTEVDTALVYYIDTKEWMIEDNLSHASANNASCSAVIKVAPGQYETWTGDYSGFLWETEQSGHNDDGEGYECKVLTPYLYFENGRLSKHYYRAALDIEPNTDYDLDVRYYVGEIFGATVSLTGTVGILGTFTLDVDILGTQHLFRRFFPVGRIGTKIQFELTNSTADEEFFIAQILIDYKLLGSQRE